MYNGFKEKVLRSLYMPCELHEVIEQRARDCFCNFNQITVQALLRVFLPHTVPLVPMIPLVPPEATPDSDAATDSTDNTQTEESCKCLPQHQPPHPPAKKTG